MFLQDPASLITVDQYMSQQLVTAGGIRPLPRNSGIGGERVHLGETWELSSRDTLPCELGKGGSWSAVEGGKDAFEYWFKLGEIKQWRGRNRTR